MNGRYPIRTGILTVFLACLATGGLLWIPPFHTTTHEFTTLFTGLMAVALYWVSGRTVHHTAPGGTRPSMEAFADAVWWWWGVAAVSSILSLGLMVLANRFLFVTPCRVEVGMPYFITTFGPAALLAPVCGATAGAFTKGRRGLVGILFVFLVLDGLHAAGQLYFGPRIFPVDLVLGDLAAFVQRGTVTVSRIHQLHGIALVSLTATIWLFARWRFVRDARDKVSGGVMGIRFGTLAVGLGATLAFWGSYAGFGWGDGATRYALRNTERTAHFDVRFSTSDEASSLIDAVEREAEWQWRRITSLWGFEPDMRVRLFVFDSPKSMERHTGIAFGHAGIGEVYVSVEDVLQTEVLAHELVHAMHGALNPNPRVLLSRGMLEGTATAFEDAYATMPEAHEWVAGAYKEGNLPSLEGVFSPFGFSANAEGGAYLMAGSFLGYLVYSHGMAPFMTLQETLDFRRAYGARLIELEEEWHRFLLTVPVRPDRKLMAAQYFDLDENPSYLAIQCPKVGRRVPRNEEKAREAYARGDYEVAAPLYRSLAEDTGALDWYRWEARAWDKSGRVEKALAALQTAESLGPLKAFQRAAIVQDRIELLARAGNWDSLNEAYDARRALGLGLGPGNVRGEACLRDPRIRDRYAALFREENPVKQWVLWRNLREAFPDDEPVQFMYVTVGINPTLPVADRCAAAMAYLRRWPEHADELAPSLRVLFRGAMVEGAYSEAISLADALATQCENPIHRYWGEQGRSRIAFEWAAEKAYPTEVPAGR